MPLIRYPGSKEKLAKQLFELFPDEMKRQLWSHASRWEYREPFFGAGAIGFKILEHLDRKCKVWINDRDEDLTRLWKTIHEDPQALLRLIHDFTPTVDAFFDFKKRDGFADCSDAERGFRKLALHRMSVSGFGVKSGGPIGGRTQASSKYTVGCRWNPERMKRDVMRLSKQLRWFTDINITCGDFEPLLTTATDECFIYCDPPYYEKGGQLYRHAMDDSDHERLAGSLKSCRGSWVLSYDDHKRIRELYSWASGFTELFITYSNATHAGIRPKNQELAITRRNPTLTPVDG